MVRTTRIAYALVRLAAIALEQRINKLRKDYPGVTEPDIRDLSSIDPTGDKGTYLDWLVRMFVQGKVSLINDEDELVQALETYTKITSSPRLLQQYKVTKNINQYTPDNLRAIHGRVQGEDLKSQRQQEIEAKSKGAKTIYDDGRYRIIQIGGPGVDLNAAIKAACLYGKETKLCTSNPDDAEFYIKEAPLYIIFENGAKIAQLHAPPDPEKESQLKNMVNGELSLADHPDMAEAIWKAPIQLTPKFVEDILMTTGDTLPRLEHRDQTILANPGYIGFYSRLVVGGRWEAGEKELEKQIKAGEFTPAIRYAVAVLGRWDYLEKILLNKAAKCTDSIDCWDVFEGAGEYASHFMEGPWEKFESILVNRLKSSQTRQDLIGVAVPAGQYLRFIYSEDSELSRIIKEAKAGVYTSIPALSKQAV